MPQPNTDNPNLCTACLPPSLTLNPYTAGAGICGKCGQIGAVWDVDLLRMYREIGIPDEMVGRDLPRLRTRGVVQS